ncbi:hypothetical protein ONE63_001428 [Megalurothrips usitatus]|uniref:Peptidase S1 domain-containing protein n=1 Tax=Megalurothrips usitatus TaxID=439358 RepID=A0AAV7XFS8_9NEOP|nr:hypothetical protein ONE63_001428 [Megalurothrips usitatus]
MKVLALNALLFAALLGQAQDALAVSGGKMALPGQFPYQVLIRPINAVSGLVNKDVSCSGALIDLQWVLTSASCLGTSAAGIYQVTLGAFDLTLDEDEETRMIYDLVTAAYPHEGYNAETGENDIALLDLGWAATKDDFIAPIRLPAKKDAKKSFWLWNGAVSGWGSVCPDDKTQGNWVLRWFDSRVQTNLWCRLRDGASQVHDTSICVSSFWKKGTCIGDSGNPLAITEWDDVPTLVGVASSSTASCASNKPAVFTRVTSYLDWISDKTGIQLR